MLLFSLKIPCSRKWSIFNSENTSYRQLHLLFCSQESKAKWFITAWSSLKAPPLDAVKHWQPHSHTRAVQSWNSCPQTWGFPVITKPWWSSQRDHGTKEVKVSPTQWCPFPSSCTHTEAGQSSVPQLCFLKTKHSSAVHQEVAWGKTTAWVTGSS